MQSRSGSLPSSPQSQGLMGRSLPSSPQSQGLMGRSVPSSPLSQGLMGPYNSGSGPSYFRPISRAFQPKAKPNDVGSCIPVVQSHRPPLPSVYVTHNQAAGARQPLPFQKTGVSLPLPLPHWNPEHRQWHPWSGQPSKVITSPKRNLIALSPIRHSSSLSRSPKTPSYSPIACSPLLSPTQNGLSPSTTPKTMSTTPKTLSQSPAACSPLFAPTRNSPSLSSNPKTLSTAPKTLSQSSTACSSFLSPARPSPSLSSTPHSPSLSTRSSTSLSSTPHSPLLSTRSSTSLSSTPHSPLLSSTRPNPPLSSTPHSPLLSSTRPSPPLSSTAHSPLLSSVRPSPSLYSTPHSPLLSSARPSPPLSSTPHSPLLSSIRPSPPLSSTPQTPLLSPRPSPSLSSTPQTPLLSPRPSPSLSSTPQRPLLSSIRPSPSLSSTPHSPLLSPRNSPSLSSTPQSPLLSPRPKPSLSSTPQSPLLSPRPSPSLSSTRLSSTRHSLSLSSTACNPSLSPLPRRPVVGHQDCAAQQHKDNASNKKSVPGGSTSLSLKRPRESESADNSAKKLCVQDPSCVPARSPVCTSAGQSLSPSLAPKPSLSKDLSPKTAQGRLYTAPASGQSTLSSKLVQTKLSVSSQPPTSPLARQSSPLARLYLSPAPKSSFTRQYRQSLPKPTSPMNRQSFSPTHKSTVTRPPSSSQPPNFPFTRLPLTPKSPLTSVSLSPIPKSPLTRQALSQPPKSPVTTLSLPQPSKSPMSRLSLPQRPNSLLTRRALSQPPKSPVTKLSLSQPPRQSSSGVKPAYLGFTVKQKDMRSPGLPNKGSLKRWIEEYRRKVNEGEMCPPLPVASTVSQNKSTVEVKYQRRVDIKGETGGQERQGTDRTPTKLTPKPNTGYVGRLSLKHKRVASGGHDIVEFFTPPDPVHEPANTAREKGPPAGRVAGSGTFRVGSQGEVTLNLRSLDTKKMPKLQMMAVVKLDRLNLENMCLKKGVSFPNGSFTASSLQQRKDKRGKSTRKSARLCQIDALKEDAAAAASAAASAATAAASSKCDSSVPPRGSPETAAVAACQADGDPLDLELGLSFELDMNLSQSSSSSSSSSSCEEEEQMRSMRAIMDRITRQTPLPEPERSNTQLLSSKMVHYKNTLDQTRLHISNTIESKANENRLLEDCKVDLLSEEAEAAQEDAISAEQQEFLQRYALAPSSMRDVHPGEEVFNLASAGRIFTQDSLQPGQCNATPQGTVQKALLCSRPSQFRKHLRVDLPTSAYGSSPCPPDVTLFLFKVMSVHKEIMAATLTLNSLSKIAIAAADQRVRNGSQQFAVWVPSISELTLVFMNMGVSFVGLYPNETLQPSFTEGDVMEGTHIGSDSPSSSGEPSAFPLDNFNYVLQYLDLCTRLCPHAYDDHELLLLLTVVCRLSLDVQLVLQPHTMLCCLLESIISNVSDWDAALPRMCAALVELTADHHNMCCLVNKLPRHNRGQQLRTHLSMCMISTLLDGSCTYQPTVGEFQLSALRTFLPRMRPSMLLHGMQQNATEPSEDDDQVSLDMQSYYLCNSLLTLMNEASNLPFYTTHQKEQLLELCSELEFHIKSHIRESEKCLYRSTVKDLVARIYTRWQMLLLRTRPLNGQLYDYWKPVRMGSQSSAEGEEDPVPVEEMEEEEEEEKERAGQQG